MNISMDKLNEHYIKTLEAENAKLKARTSCPCLCGDFCLNESQRLRIVELERIIAERQTQAVPHYWDCGCEWHDRLNFENCARYARSPQEGNATYQYTSPMIQERLQLIPIKPTDEMNNFVGIPDDGRREELITDQVVRLQAEIEKLKDAFAENEKQHAITIKQRDKAYRDADEVLRPYIKKLESQLEFINNQEPFGYWHDHGDPGETDFHLFANCGGTLDKDCKFCTPLYTHPTPIQEGYQFAPIKPTHKMLVAGMTVQVGDDDQFVISYQEAEAIYKAMISSVKEK